MRHSVSLSRVSRWISPVFAIPLLLYSFIVQTDLHAQERHFKSDTAADTLPHGALARLGCPNWRLLAEPKRLVVSPDGETLGVTLNDHTVELLDARTGKRCLRLADSSQSIPSLALAFSPDGRWIATHVRRSGDGTGFISI